MKVKTKQLFFDIEMKTNHQVDEIFECDFPRFEHLRDLGLVEEVQEVKDGVREEEVKRTVKRTTRKTR